MSDHPDLTPEEFDELVDGAAGANQVGEPEVSPGELLARLSKLTDPDSIFDLLAMAEPPQHALDRVRLREKLLDTLKGKLEAPAKAVDAWLVDQTPPTQNGQGAALALEDPEPWDEEVDGAELAAEIEAIIRRHVVAPDHVICPTVLWIIFAHVLDAFRIAPLLVVTSPTHRCGKTSLLAIILRTTPRGLPASNISPAALYRTIERFRPTFLVDEGDSFVHLSDELRGILDAGHTRDFAFVIRIAGEDLEPRLFNVWGAKAVALVGQLPAMVMDRAIHVRMTRKAAGSFVEPEDPEELRAATQPILRKATRWAIDNVQSLRGTRVQRLDGLGDRANDNWNPLRVIANTLGGSWPERVRAAALELSGADDEEAIQSMILTDLAVVFEEEGSPDELPTDSILDRLHQMEERPWGEFGRSRKPISAHALARMLKGFGVKPKRIHGHAADQRGYRMAGPLVEAIRTYTGRETPNQSSEVSAPQVEGHFEASAEEAETGGALTLRDQPESVPDQHEQRSADTLELREEVPGMAVSLETQIQVAAARAEATSELARTDYAVAKVLNRKGITPPPGFTEWSGKVVRLVTGEP